MNLIERFEIRPDYHQLSSYGLVMKEIGWDVIHLQGCQLFIKKIGPVAFAKLQRPSKVNFVELIERQRQHRILHLHLEPGLKMSLDQLERYGFKTTRTHYAYTKTLIVDLSHQEKEILASFSKTTAYQMRRSRKMGVEYEAIPFRKLTNEGKQEILNLHAQWSREKKIAGYDDAFLKALWKHMREGTMILARVDGQLHGALFLLIHHKLAMYFYQFTSREAREGLYIPSGMAYEAILLAKKQGCDLFDLCSAYDERYSKENLKWKGFSTHKERFHPTAIYYPVAYARDWLPFLR